MVGIALAFHAEALHLIVNQLKTIVNRQILADVVNDQVETSLEDPGRGEEARPGLHSVVEGLGLRAHEEAGVATDLAQVTVPHLRLDDRVDEVEGKGVFLHAHTIKVIKLEFADALNQNCKFAAKEEAFCLEVDFVIVAGRGEDVVTDAHVIDKDLLEHGCLVLVTEDLVLLERLEVVNVEVANDTCGVLVGVHELHSGQFLFLLVHDFRSDAHRSGGALCLLILRVADIERGDVWHRGFGRRSLSLGSLRLGLRHRHRHRHGVLLRRLIGLGDIFSINEVDSVRVDNTTVVVLALDFKVVSNQHDRPARVHRMLRFERRSAEAASAASTAAPAATLVTTATGPAALIVVVGPPALSAVIIAVLLVASTTAAVILLLMAAASVPPLLLVATLVLALIAASMALVAAHVLLWLVLLVLLRLLLPGLALAHLRLEATLVVLRSASPAVLGSAAPLLRAILLVSTSIRWLIVVLHCSINFKNFGTVLNLLCGRD